MAALDWASSSSTESTAIPSSFNVFLSFRGKDVRNSFISFLHQALKCRGINVFVDSNKQWVGEAIGPTLRKAIEGSKISIPVFSKGYADSKWCLRELALIVQCRSNGQLVLPIFFHIDPSHVRHQTGSFKEAFEKHEKNVRLKPGIVQGWREALETVGSLIGEVVDETKDQAEQVELVVKRVLGELYNGTHLAGCKYPVGVDSLVHDVLSLLNNGFNDVQFVGICGFGGIGKTTIAKAVYDHSLLNFSKHSFLSNVREQAMQIGGLLSLQKRLLKDIFRTDIDIADSYMGEALMQQRLCKEKILLVLDDVDSKEQVDALVGDFGQGSKVIITSRDEHILHVAKVDTDKIYWPKVLDPKQSLQLFSLHAFSTDQPLEEYMKLSEEVARYSGGLPLTLEVLGSYLSDVRSKEVWVSTLQKLKDIPNDKVQRRLKISYDTLEDDYQKAIFLDAACLFIGWEKKDVISIWEACGYYPESAIDRLIKRSLLEFEWDKDNDIYCLKMHDQIRDMGREIVLERGRMELGKRSRLWSRDEICEVLEGHKGTDMINGIVFPSESMTVSVSALASALASDSALASALSLASDFGSALAYLSWARAWARACVSSEDFEMMSNLRVLSISSKNFKGDFSRLPSALRWFKWVGCRLGIPPTNFYHNRLRHLILVGTNIRQAWNIRPQDENKRFQMLKVLDLDSCMNLSKSPNFSWFPYLERLNLCSCISLDTLDESIGQLSQLKILSLQFCISLKKLPESIGDLKSLVTLDLSATLIEELPDSISRLSSLKELILLECISLKKLPESIVVLKSLVKFKLSRGLEITRLPSKYERIHTNKLRRLVKRPSSLMEIMRCLQGINLPESSTLKIPNDFSMFSNLKILELSHCEELEYIRKLPSSLVVLSCWRCYSLVQLPDLSRLKHLTKLMLKDCKKLEQIRGLEGTESLEELDARGCYNWTHNPQKEFCQGTPPGIAKRSRYDLTRNGGFYCDAGLTLCIGFKFPRNLIRYQELKQGRLPPIYFDISASICKKDKKIRCRHTLRFEDVEFTDGYIFYFHNFEGFEWFGIPLEGKDAIENLCIEAPTSRPDSICRVLFWGLWSNCKKKPNTEEGKEEKDNEDLPLVIRHQKKKRKRKSDMFFSLS